MNLSLNTEAALSTRKYTFIVKRTAARILGLILLFAGTTFVSHGQTSESGFFVGGGPGDVQNNGFSDLCRDITDVLPRLNVSVDCDPDERVAGGKIVLGWRFSPYVAVEGGFGTLGAEDQKSILRQTLTDKFGVDLFFTKLVGSVPVGARVKLLGKLGITNVDGNLSIHTERPVAVPLGLNVSSESSTEALVGFGAEYNFSQKLAGRLEWERIDFLDGIDRFLASILFYPKTK